MPPEYMTVLCLDFTLRRYELKELSLSTTNQYCVMLTPLIVQRNS